MSSKFEDTFEEHFFDYPLQMILMELLVLVGLLTPAVLNWGSIGGLAQFISVASAFFYLIITLGRLSHNFETTTEEKE